MIKYYYFDDPGPELSYLIKEENNEFLVYDFNTGWKEHIYINDNKTEITLNEFYNMCEDKEMILPLIKQQFYNDLLQEK